MEDILDSLRAGTRRRGGAGEQDEHGCRSPLHEVLAKKHRPTRFYRLRRSAMHVEGASVAFFWMLPGAKIPTGTAQRPTW